MKKYLWDLLYFNSKYQLCEEKKANIKMKIFVILWWNNLRIKGSKPRLPLLPIKTFRKNCEEWEDFFKMLKMEKIYF